MPPVPDDDRFLTIDGRRWRRSDPAIPDALRAELVSELMAARRAVRTDPDARPRVQDAKVALGERGRPWWEPPDDAAVRDRAAAAIRALLRHRAGKTICPSDVARVVGGERWRAAMPAVREVAAELADAGQVVVTQRGEPVSLQSVRGPVRLASVERSSDPTG